MLYNSAVDLCYANVFQYVGSVTQSVRLLKKNPDPYCCFIYLTSSEDGRVNQLKV